jgi:hypothetical protein
VLTDNEIEALPPALGERPLLQKLMLAGNRLRTLPESMAQLHKLELLRIASNQLQSLPSWLLSLPRLRWLAYAGNPLCDQLEDTLVHTPSATVRWPELTLGDKLGEGASGVFTAPLAAGQCRRRCLRGSQTLQRRHDQRRLAAERNGRLPRRRRAPEPDPGPRPH